MHTDDFNKNSKIVYISIHWPFLRGMALHVHAATQMQKRLEV